jgi:hypothetical protein
MQAITLPGFLQSGIALAKVALDSTKVLRQVRRKDSNFTAQNSLFQVK